MWIYSKRMQFFIQLFCFKKCDYLTMLCVKIKFIWCSFTAMTTPQAPIPKLRKSHNISRVFHLLYPPQNVPVSLNGPVAELLWVPGVFLAVRTACISLSRKCDVTEWRSRPWVVTRGRMVLVESFVMSLTLNLSLSRRIVQDVVLNCLDIWILRITA